MSGSSGCTADAHLSVCTYCGCGIMMLQHSVLVRLHGLPQWHQRLACTELSSVEDTGMEWRDGSCGSPPLIHSLIGLTKYGLQLCCGLPVMSGMHFQ